MSDAINRVCSVCKKAKPPSDYYSRGRNAGGLTAVCKICTRIKVKAWRAANPEVFRQTRQKMKYGITENHYQELLKKQGGVCAVCGSPESGNASCRRLVVDHCHETGAVRGLLCHQCNTGIGQLRDSAEMLEKAAAYLRGAAACPLVINHEIACKHCFGLFIPNRAGQEYCNQSCRRKGYRLTVAVSEKESGYVRRDDVRERRRIGQQQRRAKKRCCDMPPS